MWLIDDPDKYRTYRIGRRDERGNYLPAINLGVPIEGAGDNDAERSENTKRNREIAEDVLRRFKLLGNGSLTVEEVERGVQEIVARAARANSGETTAHIMIEWLWKNLGLAYSRFSSMQAMIHCLLTFLDKKARQDPSRVIHADLETFSKQRATSGQYRKATIRTHIKAIKQIYHYAKEVLHVIGINPARGLGMPSEAKRGRGRVAFEVNEVRCLLRWLETIGETGVEWKTLVLIAGFTAMRLADALNLTWEEVDLDAEEIRFDQNKLDYLRRKGVEIPQMCIPIHGELLRRLRYHRDLVLRAAKPLKGYIVPYLQGRGEDQIGGAFIKLLNQAGLWTEQAPQKGFDRKPLRRGFHSFRHAVITWMKKAGIAKELRKEFAGHSEESASHDDYDHAKNDAGVLRKHVLSALPSLDADPEETADTEPLAAPEIALSSIPTEALMGELAKRVGTKMEK